MLTQATPKTKNRRKQTWRLIAQRIFKWKARKIGLLELTFYVFSRILNLQIHAHIYRSFIRHHKMLGVRIAKRKIEPQKPANPCGTRLCSCIFSVNTRQTLSAVVCVVKPLPFFYFPDPLLNRALIFSGPANSEGRFSKFWILSDFPSFSENRLKCPLLKETPCSCLHKSTRSDRLLLQCSLFRRIRKYWQTCFSKKVDGKLAESAKISSRNT